MHSFKLVEGTFCPADAADILFTLLSDKIKFHQLQLLILQHSSNEKMLKSKQRIDALKSAKADMKDLIIKARDEGYELEIDSDITINLIKQSK